MSTFGMLFAIDVTIKKNTQLLNKYRDMETIYTAHINDYKGLSKKKRKISQNLYEMYKKQDPVITIKDINTKIDKLLIDTNNLKNTVLDNDILSDEQILIDRYIKLPYLNRKISNIIINRLNELSQNMKTDIQIESLLKYEKGIMELLRHDDYLDIVLSKFRDDNPSITYDELVSLNHKRSLYVFQYQALLDYHNITE